ncbi:MAG TPA: UDP-N-acetylmuramoyl-L-alanine--D-glutamate ligase [Acidimicrobiales bacterium]|nr:UDP-N-acetylmuramoyl-L-alanine--D-glutamate ligase [Acidimicrobiales bacterium]
MKLESLVSSRVAIWGMGDEGVAFARLLTERGASPILVDDDPVGAAGRVATLTERPPVVHPPDPSVLAHVDAIVRSPGVSRYRPELVGAAASGVAVTTPLAVWLEDFHGAPIMAVTGTKGKSTTATLAARILEQHGGRVALAGNIGVPVTDLYGQGDFDAYVVEVSSYQAAEVTASPPVTVLTSLAPDHLDWHGGVEAYYRDKLRLISAGPPAALAVNAASAEAVSRTADHPGRMLYGEEGRVRARSGWIGIDGEPLVDYRGLRTPGQHNVANLCGAIAGVLLLTGSRPQPAALVDAIEGFEGLPSRCQSIGTRGGLEFVDDALASNPFATAASVASYGDRPMTLILGGADRGVDFTRLAEVVAARVPVPHIVVIPPDGRRIADRVTTVGRQCRVDVPVSEAADPGDAARRAWTTTPPGGVVLFSPAAPTPEGEGGFRERSRLFREAFEAMTS